ncbi:hypothetical protein MWU38_00230 [Qipengyuania sp. S6317L1]|uniref:hypothetical protein n=1 Tax=Qipengyuania sp. S6317L1 TaxID=2926410 RepID=UPI001FF2AAEA|nr:hypothetical protein [Qipengyuania sp. S6317L1]MCK0097796.1 hypothetical protein [Qipengyuania sp. S6317L1]
MSEIEKLNQSKPRKIGEVEWSESGMRLSPVQRVVESDWFWPAMLTFPIGAFLIVFFW